MRSSFGSGRQPARAHPPGLVPQASPRARTPRLVPQGGPTPKHSLTRLSPKWQKSLHRPSFFIDEVTIHNFKKIQGVPKGGPELVPQSLPSRAHTPGLVPLSFVKELRMAPGNQIVLLFIVKNWYM